MDHHHLPFATITIIREDIAEVVIHEGISLDVNMVDQFHEFLLKYLKAPFSVLINKLNSYTYDFNAQLKLATLKEIKAIAVVVYNQAAKLTTATMASYPRETQWNIRIFSDRNHAVNWLVSEQNI